MSTTEIKEAVREAVREVLREAQATRPTYSSRDLRELLGYGRDEALQIIRSHGKFRRVTAENLKRYQLGLPAKWGEV